jgi:hypothetical protein
MNVNNILDLDIIKFALCFFDWTFFNFFSRKFLFHKKVLEQILKFSKFGHEIYLANPSGEKFMSRKKLTKEENLKF